MPALARPELVLRLDLAPTQRPLPCLLYSDSRAAVSALARSEMIGGRYDSACKLSLHCVAVPRIVVRFAPSSVWARMLECSPTLKACLVWTRGEQVATYSF
ncbi:hypothetical protein Acr_11g0011400 [Actinidia rufa]|uniref:Uncharacterized protein n=1 Tax=Actinidia rufa TaxID=165716 RepID=A0A7J0FDQ3_9ERIC|nr:hypothetical protein Acr_11g0011400 [Actinidia rufa]